MGMPPQAPVVPLASSAAAEAAAEFMEALRAERFALPPRLSLSPRSLRALRVSAVFSAPHNKNAPGHFRPGAHAGKGSSYGTGAISVGKASVGSAVAVGVGSSGKTSVGSGVGVAVGSGVGVLVCVGSGVAVGHGVGVFGMSQVSVVWHCEHCPRA